MGESSKTDLARGPFLCGNQLFWGESVFYVPHFRNFALRLQTPCKMGFGEILPGDLINTKLRSHKLSDLPPKKKKKKVNFCDFSVVQLQFCLQRPSTSVQICAIWTCLAFIILCRPLPLTSAALTLSFGHRSLTFVFLLYSQGLSHECCCLHSCVWLLRNTRLLPLR